MACTPPTVVIILFPKVCGKWNWMIILFWYPKIEIQAQFVAMCFAPWIFWRPLIYQERVHKSFIHNQNQDENTNNSVVFAGFSIANLTSRLKVMWIKASWRYFWNPRLLSYCNASSLVWSWDLPHPELPGQPGQFHFPWTQGDFECCFQVNLDLT